MPISNTDRILLSHGGGGRRTEELIKNVFAKYLANPILDGMDDAAFLGESELRTFFSGGAGRVNGLVFTTDSFVVKPLFFPGGDIGRLAVSGTVNDIAVMGARPIALSAAFILEEGLKISELESVLESMSATLREADVQVVTADTKVVERGRGEGVYISMSGIGMVEVSPPPSLRRIEPGDVLIINGPIGLHGLAVMLERQGMEFEGKIESDVAPLWGLVSSVLGPEIKFMRDPTRGGLAMTLNEIADATGLGIVIDENLIPITPEVETVSELLGIEPIEIANEGKVLMVVARERADEVLEKMKMHRHGREAAVIGEVTDSTGGRVVMRTKLGTTKIVSKPVGETLPRIC